jgi:hypothetical protein
MRLTLDTGSRYTLHDILTKEDEDKEQGYGYHGNSRHLLRNVGLTGGGILKRGTQTVSDQMILCGSNESGPYVGVPRTHHLKNGDRYEGGKCERDHYLPEILKVGCTVNLSSEIKLVGNLQEVLS